MLPPIRAEIAREAVNAAIQLMHHHLGKDKKADISIAELDILTQLNIARDALTV